MYNTELYHWGIKGQKWGERRYQYEDGSLTPEGRIHYGYGAARDKVSSAYNSAKKSTKNAVTVLKEKTSTAAQSVKDFYNEHETAIKTGAAVAATALAVYGGYKLVKSGALQQAAVNGKLALTKMSINTDANALIAKNKIAELPGKAKVAAQNAGHKLNVASSIVKDNVAYATPKVKEAALSTAKKAYVGAGKAQRKATIATINAAKTGASAVKEGVTSAKAAGVLSSAQNKRIASAAGRAINDTFDGTGVTKMTLNGVTYLYDKFGNLVGRY